MLGGGDALQLSLIATLLCSAASIATNATVLPTFIFVLGGDGSALLIRSIPTLLRCDDIGLRRLDRPHRDARR